MIIPVGFGHVVHKFIGDLLPEGAAITYGVNPNGGTFENDDVEILHDLFASTVVPELSTLVTLEETTIKYGPQSTGATVFFIDPVAGGQSGGVAPPNTAYLIEKKTALGGRRNRGRFFLPGVVSSATTDSGGIAPTFVTSLTTAVQSFLAGMNTAGMDMVILHTASSDPTIVTELQVDPRLATQRRRLR